MKYEFVVRKGDDKAAIKFEIEADENFTTGRLLTLLKKHYSADHAKIIGLRQGFTVAEGKNDDLALSTFELKKPHEITFIQTSNEEVGNVNKGIAEAEAKRKDSEGRKFTLTYAEDDPIPARPAAPPIPARPAASGASGGGNATEKPAEPMPRVNTAEVNKMVQSMVAALSMSDLMGGGRAGNRSGGCGGGGPGLSKVERYKMLAERNGCMATCCLIFVVLTVIFVVFWIFFVPLFSMIVLAAEGDEVTWIEEHTTGPFHHLELDIRGNWECSAQKAYDYMMVYCISTWLLQLGFPLALKCLLSGSQDDPQKTARVMCSLGCLSLICSLMWFVANCAMVNLVTNMSDNCKALYYKKAGVFWTCMEMISGTFVFLLWILTAPLALIICGGIGFAINGGDIPDDFPSMGFGCQPAPANAQESTTATAQESTSATAQEPTPANTGVPKRETV